MVLSSTATARAQSIEPAEPPSLVTRTDAPYPPDAKRERREGSVELELLVGEDGKVIEAKVTTPAGHGFDEAALAAARSFVFTPATQGGKPIRSVVAFTYAFHLPAEEPPPSAPPPAAPSPPPSEARQEGADQSTLVVAQRATNSASSLVVRERDFRLRPIGTAADILRVTPGLVVVQHAGGGKANQYFLRGFDADHGTDVALSVDGIPINMVSHGHGQGYADTTFIIPETIERVDVTKGPYAAEQGDFATAGAVNLVTKTDFEHAALGFAASGSPRYGSPSYRALVVASPKLERTKPMLAAEIGRNNGPFENAERFDRYKAFGKVSFEPFAKTDVVVGAASYAGDWLGSGQIPARGVADGTLRRFGTLDPTEGGSSGRHQLFASLKSRPGDGRELEISTFAGQYRLNIVSNFTGFLNDPVSGDQITQKDRRTFAGGKASYRMTEKVGGVRFDTTFGGNVRVDAIDNALERTRARAFSSTTRKATIHESGAGVFAKEEIAPLSWLRVMGGARADFYSFSVDDALEQPSQAEGATGGTRGASQLSPKGSVVVSPLAGRDATLDLYANYGHGFHSNDARGVVRALDPVTPLTRAVGYEGGARARFFDRWDLTTAVWRLDLANETVWIGDEGTTETSGATRRFGIELGSRLALTDWLSADVDVTASRARYVDSDEAVTLAPRATWAAGLSARHPSGLRAGLRMYGIGDRPATGDRALTAEGFNLVDLHAGYTARRWDVAVDVENLFDTRYRSAQFATTSRLPSEPSTSAPALTGACGGGSRVVSNGGSFGGCEDVNFTPGYPLTLRVMTTFYLD